MCVCVCVCVVLILLYRIIILVEMSVVAKGSDVNGIIGHPSLLDLVRAEATGPVSGTSTVHGTPLVNGQGKGYGTGRNNLPQQSMNGT